MCDTFSTARQAAMVDLAKWLVCVYRSLDEFDYNEELMAKLKTVMNLNIQVKCGY